MRKRKTGLSVAVLALTALGPWLRWDRGADLPHQALLFSFTEMRAYCFGLELWAQDFYYLVAVLVVAALGLFLMTALYGRVWCGFACPQTVWTDLFVAIERLTEGERYQRIALDKAPWSVAKLTRKALKHLAWLAVSALTGGIFVFYFTDAIQGAGDLLTGRASATLYGFWGGFAGMTYIMAGWGRDQICTYMCPWPRIQGGMLDDQSRLIAYDAGRGEARGHARAGQSFADRGHCVDCGICVQVCPVGIDIRDGAQMECIACGLCADGCDQVMTRFGLPPHLVGWSGGGRLMRPRSMLYAGLIGLTLTVALLGFQHRQTLRLFVLPDRSPSSVHLADGSSRNAYTLRVINQNHLPVTANLTVDGLDGAKVSVVGQAQSSLRIKADGVETYRVLIEQPAELGQSGRNDLHFQIQNADTGQIAQAASLFLK